MTINVRTMDVVPVIASESAFDESHDEEMSEMSSKKYPVRERRKSAKGGWKITKKKIMANLRNNEGNA